MAVAFIFELPDFTAEQSAAVLRELELDTNPVAGQVFHLEGPMEGGGTRVVDVWESPEALQTFVQGRLAAAFQKVGATLPADLQPQAVWPVTDMFMAK